MTRLLSESYAPHGVVHAAWPLQVPTQARQCWGIVAKEPPLVEVLADPVVHLMMRGDGVTHTELEALILRVQNELRNGQCRQYAALG